MHRAQAWHRDGLVTSQKAQRAKFKAFRGPDRGCSPHRTAYNCAVRWEKRKPVIEPGMSMHNKEGGQT